MSELFKNEEKNKSINAVSTSQNISPRHNLAADQGNSYTAANIEVLEGLEPVRRRPGMYIGGTDEAALMHLFSEVIDNAVDEAVAGYADRIEVVLEADGSISVTDNGRGIPVDEHPKFKGKSALEVIMTTLHAGGKFGSGAYTTSGGLHGVGISVVNALSSRLIVEVAREQKFYRQIFARGTPITSLEYLGEIKNRRGTRIQFFHDSDIFDAGIKFKPKQIFQIARSKAYLSSGLEIRWSCAPCLLENDPDTPEKATFCYAAGLKDFLRDVLGQAATITVEPFTGKAKGSDPHDSLEWAIAWVEDQDGCSYSYCNTISTPEGGTHETGLRAALLNGLRAYGELIGEKKSSLLSGEDISVSAVIMLSLFISEPEFQGQTKEKLTSRRASRIVEQIVRDSFDHWLVNNQTQSRKLLDWVIGHAEERLRRRQEKEVARKSATRKLRLPGKLIDCSRQGSKETEIFLVEGDSAGGSAKLARDRTIQAILPLRGKILNVASAGSKKINTSQQLEDLVLALGCGTKTRYESEQLRYEKVIIMTDADVDGAHIASLLITFFFKEMPRLIYDGHLYLAAPPLYRLTYGGNTFYAHDDSEKDNLLSTRFKPNAKVEVGRFKGLGEMTPKQLRETTMDPAKRTLLRVLLSENQKEEVTTCVENLMGSRVESRFSFIQERAHFATENSLDI